MNIVRLRKISPTVIAIIAILVGSAMVVSAVGLLSNYIEMPNTVKEGATISIVEDSEHQQQWIPGDIDIGKTYYFGIEVQGHEVTYVDAMLYINITHGGLTINNTDSTKDVILTYNGEAMSLTNSSDGTYLYDTISTPISPNSTDDYYLSVTYYALGTFNIEVSVNLPS